jgi:hypothetical protein
MTLLFFRRYRENPNSLFWICVIGISGMILNRINVSGLATLTLAKGSYFPSIMEWVTTLGILSAGALIFLFCVEFFNIFQDLNVSAEKPGHVYLDHTDWRSLFFNAKWYREAQVYSFVFIFAIALMVGCLPENAIFGIKPEQTETIGPRSITMDKIKVINFSSRKRNLSNKGKPKGTEQDNILLLDGNRAHEYVLFNHDMHINQNGGKASCSICHHMNKPFDNNTSCYECHRDMYLTMDIFNHQLHVEKMGGNEYCKECHQNNDLPKIRMNTTPCMDCHVDMIPKKSPIIKESDMKKTLAVGYFKAMHGLCIECHKRAEVNLQEKYRDLSSCKTCHRETNNQLCIKPKNKSDKLSESYINFDGATRCQIK